MDSMEPFTKFLLKLRPPCLLPILYKPPSSFSSIFLDGSRACKFNED